MNPTIDALLGVSWTPSRIAWLVLLCVTLLMAVGWWRTARRGSRGAKRRVSRAQVGEKRAERLLTRAGFRIVERQASAVGWMRVDGREVAFDVRADFIVEAVSHTKFPPGTRLVAEVKTGARAPNPALPATRRQLLEYDRIYEPDAIILVDMNAGVIIDVAFDVEA